MLKKLHLEKLAFIGDIVTLLYCLGFRFNTSSTKMGPRRLPALSPDFATVQLRREEGSQKHMEGSHMKVSASALAGMAAIVLSLGSCNDEAALESTGPAVAPSGPIRFRLVSEVGGERLEKAAADALAECRSDLEHLLGLGPRSTSSELEIVLLSRGQRWLAAEARLRASAPHIALDDPVLGLTEWAGGQSLVCVPFHSPRYLDLVELPWVVRETLVHEAFHLAFITFHPQCRDLPVWLHEGVAWAMADRALHRTTGETRCHLCARGLGVLSDGRAEIPMPSVRETLEYQTVASTLAAGIMMRVVLESEPGAHRASAPSEPPRSLVPLCESMLALPPDAPLEAYVAELLDFAGMTETELGRAMEERRSRLRAPWLLLEGNALLDYLDDAIILGPLGSNLAAAVLRSPLRGEHTRIDASVEILAPTASCNVQAGWGSGAAVAFSWHGPDHSMFFQQRNPLDGETDRSLPLPNLPGHPGPWAMPLPFRFSVSPERLIIEMQSGGRWVSKEFPRLHDRPLHERRVMITAEGGPVLFKDLRVLSR